MNNPILHQFALDVIALETKHQEDYEKACQEREFAQNYQDQPCLTFEDGKYDGELEIEPQPYQWFEPSYQKGYLAGVTNRFNEQLFQEFPWIFFQLIQQEQINIDAYEFIAPEIKQRSFRLDGLFTTTEEYSDLPLFFVEVQFYEETDFYDRLFPSIFLSWCAFLGCLKSSRVAPLL